ncbi:SDR family NAD(P)-dependent oxidoreductase [Altererythrobacter arenosus]|uniref:SDR family NAD(P)-dependent oxidoreductase n=1 Tax=Altererythrobacter arenosus TaxID=3032592 RepID=A0ABY8FQK8_9SPHN|nr:SDR family NAD(P)-dependent oxidoreductase [Altererythrobacter sp. CAU 1644]WFL77280.1 SDR family NAD(P)-dependent oxidoreductase [Altererythrobacter sp. CAU 1644]
MDVAGKSVLLTGGSSGIGREIARQLKAKGAKVAVTGRDKERLAAMRDEGFETIEARLGNAHDVDGLVADLGTRDIDILINNAGQGVDHDFRVGAPDPDATDACIYANLHAPIRLITALMPRLKARPEAAIVNVTSGLAIAPNGRSPVYCATKAGLRSYTQSLREQLSGTGVHVMEALPPLVETNMTAGREGKMMAPQDCARQIVDAIERDRPEANVGQVKLLRRIYSISPALARRIMLRF